VLEIDDLTYRIDSRLLFDSASARIAEGWKVGVVGRNGTGKSTLLKLIREEVEGLTSGKGASGIRLARGARLGHVAQEIAASDTPLLDVVLGIDTEVARLFEEAETATDPERIAEIHMRLADRDAHTAPARAGAILAGLGFTPADLQRASREFSGGWRMRAALAGVLVAAPDLLLLDEPTNYLDLEGAAWLEGYIRKYPGTVLLVSHDREMLNRAVTHILALEAGKFVVQTGGYDTYVQRRAERNSQLAGARDKQAAQKAHLQSFIDRFRAKASKARQAQARIKMLQRMQDIPEPLEDRALAFRFEDAPELASPLIELREASLGYIAGRPVLNRVEVRVDAEDRIAIIGTNGQGKTTLVRSLAAKLKLLSGQRIASGSLKVGYFSQDQMDELTPGDTALAHVRAKRPNLTEPQVRALAAQIGFPREKTDTRVESLSGGEKVRLLMGLMALDRPHVLVLDEPTSHLDIDSREALILALNGFKGAVLLITHDVYLAEACADRLWLVREGQVGPYDGDLSDYRQLVLSADRQAAAPARTPPPTPVEAAPAVRPAGKAGASASSLRRKMEEAEKRLDTARASLEVLDRRLAGMTTGGAELSKALDERAALESRIATLEAQWLEAAEALG
jgi:ATP-binding cassette subfamily F protein 3